MGHYASEMGYYRRDEYDYLAVNDAGFISEKYRSTKKTCPHCFCVVEGIHALKHLEALHSTTKTKGGN